MNTTDLLNEFDRQLQTLINKGYPEASHLTEETFINKVMPLRSMVHSIQVPECDLQRGTLPFVIVIRSDLIPSEKMMELVEKDGKNGITILRPHSSENFNEIDEVSTVGAEVYLLCDIDRGKENINLPPNEAMKIIKQAGRSPLTIDEGIAIVTHFPEFLIKNNCFSLLASRTGVDQRVPAIWINGNKQPNLGWCWDGNPHTWLGSASCRERVS